MTARWLLLPALLVSSPVAAQSAPDGAAVILTHTACDRRFTPALVCDQCRGRLRGSQIQPVSYTMQS